MSPDMVRYTPRSGEHGDCVVSALHAATGKTFDETLIACTLNEPDVLRNGMTNKTIIATVKDLGFTPRIISIPKGKKARAEFVEFLEDEEVTGILSVMRGHDNHAVYIWAGRVIEPRRENPGLWLHISDYLESEGWKPTEFMTLKEDEA